MLVRGLLLACFAFGFGFQSVNVGVLFIVKLFLVMHIDYYHVYGKRYLFACLNDFTEYILLIGADVCSSLVYTSIISHV